jgi:hypothetical protein
MVGPPCRPPQASSTCSFVPELAAAAGRRADLFWPRDGRRARELARARRVRHQCRHGPRRLSQLREQAERRQQRSMVAGAGCSVAVQRGAISMLVR